MAGDFGHFVSKRTLGYECPFNALIAYVIRSDGVYFSLSDTCGKKKAKKSRLANWEKSGYKKKPTCDICGFKAVYHTQLTVFHIDGDLKNTQFSNLRTICLNCVEVVKRKDVNWKRGDLQVDY